MATCSLNGINPRTYLTWVFDKLAHDPMPDKPELLLPWHCEERRHGFIP
ncbi:transposase domain-containing protein [Frigidibacter sp. MR17.14]